MVYLCGYCELLGRPQHSSDVFCHRESISDRFTGIWALYRSTSVGWKASQRHYIIEKYVNFHSFSLNFIVFHWFSIDLQLHFANVFEYVGDLDSPETILEMIQRFWNIQKSILDEKIRRSCATEALQTRNSHRDRPFWKLSCCVKKNTIIIYENMH